MVHTETRSPIEVVLARIVYYVFGVIEIVLAMRFVLKLFGANAQAGFVQFVYAFSAMFMAPFTAIFRTQTVEHSTFEWSVLVAIAVYALVAWGIVALVNVVTPRRSSETVERVQETDDSQARS